MASALRAALAAKRVRETVYRITVADPTVHAANLEQAKRNALLAGLGKDAEEPAAVRAREELEEAQAALDACFYPLRLRGIPRADLEALTAAHPGKGEEVWDRDGLTPGLVAACAVDSDLTPEEWAAELSSDRWTDGDTAGLFSAAMGVCIHPVNDLGKG